jgi:hypothetical protein
VHFQGMAAQHDSCSDPKRCAAKLEAHLRQIIAAKRKLAQFSAACSEKGSRHLPCIV